MYILKISLLFLISMFIQGCGSSTLDIDFQVPSIRFQSPETTGKTLGARGNIGLGSAHKVSLARSRQAKSIFSSNPGAVTIDANTEYSETQHLGYGLNFGLLSRLEFAISKRGESNFKGGLQTQLWGPIGHDQNGLKISLAGNVGTQRDDEVSRADLFEKQEDFNNVNGITHLKAWDLSVITGHRINPQFMPYLNCWFEENKVESTITVNGQSPISLDNLFQAYGVLLGGIYQFKAGDLQLFFQSEIGKSKIKNRQNQNSTRTAWGLTAGLAY